MLQKNASLYLFALDVCESTLGNCPGDINQSLGDASVIPRITVRARLINCRRVLQLFLSLSG